MSLSNDLISQFAKVTKNVNDKNKEAVVYGTTVSLNDKMYVKIDGSEILTPVVTTSEIKSSERVTVMIKDHYAMITGNISAPSASTDTTDGIKAELSSISAQLGEFELIIADKAEIDDLKAANALIKNLEAAYAEISELVANKASIEDLTATNAIIENLKTEYADIKKLVADKASIDDLKATNASITQLQANKADVTDLTAAKGEITQLKSETAKIGTLESNIASIDNLLAGNITADNIATGAITAGSGIIANGAIGDAQISSLDAAKISAGTIDTSKVTVAGPNSNLKMSGNRLQVFTGTGVSQVERVSLGDVNGDGTKYGLLIRGADGKTVIMDENGVTNAGITDGSITNDKVNPNANIDGSKLNINSVVSKINEDGTETIQGTKIEVDGTTLNTKLSNITIKQTEDSERITQAQSQITANTNAIKLKVDEQTYTTDKKDMTTKLEKNTSEITAMKGEIALKVEQTDIENAINEATLSRADFIARNFLSTPLIVSDPTLPIYALSGIPNPPVGAVFGGFSKENNIIRNDKTSSNGSAWAIIVGYEFYKNTTDNDKKIKIKDMIKNIADFMVNNVSIGRFNSMDFNFIDTGYKYDSTSKSWVKSNYKEIYLSTLWLQVKAMVYAYEILKDSVYSDLCFNILDSLFNTHFYINTRVASNELPTHLEWSSYEYLACDNLSTNYRFVASTKQYANQMGYYIHQSIPDVIRVFGDNERSTPKGDNYKPSDILVGLKKYLKNAYDNQNITAKPLGLPYGYFHRVGNGSGGYDYIPQNWDFIENTWGDGWFVGDVVTYTIYAFAASGLTDIAREYADNYYKLRVNTKDDKWSSRFNGSELIFYDRMDFYTGNHLPDDNSISITYTALYYEILKQIGKNEHIDACCYTLAKHQISDLDNKYIDGGYSWDISRDDSALEFKSFGEIINSQFYKNLNITSFTEIDNRFAEIKVTTDGITNTVKKDFYTKTETEGAITSKGYQTSSQVKQTVDALQLKFSQSGGYNLLYNGDFKNGTTHWYNSGFEISENNGYSCPNKRAMVANGVIGTTKHFYQTVSNIKGGVDHYTISYWYYVSDGTNGTTNPYYHCRCTVTYTDGTKAYPSYNHTTFNKWVKASMTIDRPSDKTFQSIAANFYCRDTTRTVYISEVMFDEGEVVNGFTPNANEVYDGVTSIDKDGVTVTASNVKSKTNMSADGFKITKTDTNEDVFKVNSDGTLTIKGNITVTGGSIPSSNLTGTIDNNRLSSTITTGAANGTNAKSTLDSNSTNWTNAFDRVSQWAYGAVSDTTTIDGGLIQTNTILADKMLLGRKDNLVNNWNFINDTEGSTPKGWDRGTIATTGGLPNTTKVMRLTGNGTIQDSYETSNKIYVTPGERLLVRYNVCRDSNSNGTVGFGFAQHDKNGSIIGWSNKTVGVSDVNASTWTSIKGEITIASGTAYIIPWITIRDNSTAGFWEIGNVEIIRQTTGELIVDGSITADKISSRTITANEIKSGTITTDELAANSITAEKLSANAIDGKTITGNIIKGASITGGTFNSANDIFKVLSDGTVQTNFLAVGNEISTELLTVTEINNPRYQAVLEQSYTLYVSKDVGINYGGLQDGSWYSSVSEIISYLPRNLNGYTVTIEFKTDITENINLNKFHSGQICIAFGGFTLNGYIFGYGPTIHYRIYGNRQGSTGGTTRGKIKPLSGYNYSGYNFGLAFQYTQFTIYDIDLYPDVATKTNAGGMTAFHNSMGNVFALKAEGNMRYLCRLYYNSNGYIDSSSGSCNNATFTAQQGSRLVLGDNKQAGRNTSGNPYWWNTNGEVVYTGATWDTTTSSNTNNNTGTTGTVTYTETVKSISGDTYRSTYSSWRKQGTVIQGNGWGSGNCDGYWFFGSELYNILNEGTVKSVVITITRQSGGNSGAVTHTLCGHNYQNKPSGAPSMESSILTFSLAVGGSININLTSAQITALKKFKGIGLKAAYSSGYYSVCSGSCSIKVTYVK